LDKFIKKVKVLNGTNKSVLKEGLLQ